MTPMDRSPVPELTMPTSHGLFGMRGLRRRDQFTWRSVRARNRDWLAPWEATIPADSAEVIPTFGQMVSRLRADARAGRVLPFVMTLDGSLVGQLTVGGITWGSLRSAHIGYWIDRSQAGKGLTPLAVALASDYCFEVLRLHRIEIVIRPENAASLRVPAKLGFRHEGRRPAYLHIDGDWRDHEVFALHSDEVGTSMVARLLEGSDRRHETGQ
jgi:ribosomal-protein-alanine N-acetyltransferase